MNGCDTIQANPEISGEPILSGEKCAMVASTYQDQFFYISDGACIKILREWSVIDWCQFDSDTEEGLWTYIQEIKLKNNIAPVFLSCDDQQECTYDDDCESGMITITAYVNDDCTDSLNLQYLWDLDLDDNGTIDESGEGITFDRELSLGTHRVYWKVEDRCGNQATCDYMIDVRDCKNPTPYCLSSITTTIMPEAGQIDIWAEDYDIGSTDNCTDASDLIFSFSTDINDNQRVITCDSIANGVAQSFSYNMYVTDEWGNQEYCTVTFIVQDNADWCQDGIIKGKINGKLVTQKDKSIPDAEIDIVSSIDTFSGFGMTGENGEFEYEEVPEFLKYVLRPHYNSSASKGVTTLDLVWMQRHILGLAEFDNAYDVIASDVNNNDNVNSADLLVMRKMILGVITKWPNEQDNWRFVDSSFVFSDIYEPFEFPDSIVIDQLVDTTSASNFIAIKVGDVNGSYIPSFQQNGSQSELRSTNNIEAILTSDDESSSLIINADSELDGLQFSIEVGDGTTISSSVLTETDYVIQDGVLKVAWLNTSDILFKNLTLIEFSSPLDVEKFEGSLQPEVYFNAEAYSLNLTTENRVVDKLNLSVTVLGNPFDNNLEIAVNDSESPILIEIYNSIGEQIYTRKYQYQSDISIPQEHFIQTGVYILKTRQSGQELLQKVVKI